MSHFCALLVLLKLISMAPLLPLLILTFAYAETTIPIIRIIKPAINRSFMHLNDLQIVPECAIGLPNEGLIGLFTSHFQPNILIRTIKFSSAREGTYRSPNPIDNSSWEFKNAPHTSTHIDGVDVR